MKEPLKLDLNNYKRQGNLAIDMVANAIIHERKFGREPKAIILSPAYFDLLKSWVEKTYGEEATLKEFYLDTVEIRKEKIYSGKILFIKHYKNHEA